MLLLTALPAFADLEMNCTPMAIVQTVPSPERTNVPIDVRLAAVYAGNCPGPTSFHLSLATAEGTVVTETDVTRTTQFSQILEIYPDSDLLPDTEYVFTATPNGGWGEATVVGFTTGTGTVVGLDGAPSYELLEAHPDVSAGILTIGSFEAATDPDDLSIVVLTGSGYAGNQHVVAVEDEGPHEDVWAGEAKGEMCVSIAQIDGAGVATEGGTSCLDITPRGCATAGAPSAIGVLLALGLLRRR